MYIMTFITGLIIGVALCAVAASVWTMRVTGLSMKQIQDLGTFALYAANNRECDIDLWHGNELVETLTFEE